jgi:hypothetical protein
VFYHGWRMGRQSQRRANVDYYARNRSLEIARVRVRQHGTIEFLRELRARPCADCHGVFAPHQMDFDHRDGTTKLFRLTSGAAMLRPTAVLISEAEKCDVVCANCHRLRTQARHAASRETAGGPARSLARRRDLWRAQLRLLDDLRNRPCADCGGHFAPCAMDFDHRDSRSKLAAVTRMIGRAGTARILDEAAKCDIVCANCHRLRTFQRRSVDIVRE